VLGFDLNFREFGLIPSNDFWGIKSQLCEFDWSKVWEQHFDLYQISLFLVAAPFSVCSVLSSSSER
jgi:hypothetical protein